MGLPAASEFRLKADSGTEGLRNVLVWMGAVSLRVRPFLPPSVRRAKPFLAARLLGPRGPSSLR